MSESDIKIRSIKPEDHKKVTDFIIEFYYGDEPIFSDEPKLIPGPADLTDVAECLNNGTSILCYHDTDEGEQLLGIILSAIKDRSYVKSLNAKAAKEEEGNTKYARYMRSLASMHEKVNICDMFKVDRFLYCFMCCVGREYREMNLEKRMSIASLDLAKRLGIQLWLGDTTSFYSAAIAESLNINNCCIQNMQTKIESQNLLCHCHMLGSKLLRCNGKSAKCN